MLHFSNAISAIDSHTAGEPTRIVTAGVPIVRGSTMSETRDAMQREYDWIRCAVVKEPRGHDAIVAAFLLPPCDPGADLGVVFANDVGYLGMCGHGAIGVATVAVQTGMVAMKEPETVVRIDTPVGTVACRVRVESGKVRSVTISNVASFLYRQRVIVPVDHFGKVAVDVAWGGNWFAFVEASQFGLCVDRDHLPELMPAAVAVRVALQQNGIYGVHPDRGVEEVIDHVKLFADLDEAGSGGQHGARSLTLCPGVAYDRSPCGTGTSAKLAVLCAKGELQLGEPFVSESVIGTRFLGRAVGRTKVGSFDAIVPEVEGSAWITAFQNFVIDPDDPCRFGFS